MQLQKSFGWKVVAGFLVVLLLPAAILFIAAGRVDWWEAWLLVVISVSFTVGSRIVLFRKNPDLAQERARWAEGERAKSWDRVLLPITAIYGPLLVWLIAGLDKRFGWSPPIPLAVELAGFAVIIFGYWVGTWATLVNRFFSAVVRIQTDRGHTVVTSGPYRFVRHPGYAGGSLAYLAMPLALGALVTFVPALLVVAAVVVRTALEDRTLQAELPGYAEYAQKTRYRLLPGIW